MDGLRAAAFLRLDAKVAAVALATAISKAGVGHAAVHADLLEETTGNGFGECHGRSPGRSPTTGGLYKRLMGPRTCMQGRPRAWAGCAWADKVRPAHGWRSTRGVGSKVDGLGSSLAPRPARPCVTLTSETARSMGRATPARRTPRGGRKPIKDYARGKVSRWDCFVIPDHVENVNDLSRVAPASQVADLPRRESVDFRN